MIISLVLDPYILKEIYFDNPAHKRDIQNLLLGITQNGLIIVDEEGNFKKILIEMAQKISAKGYSQQINLLLVELLNNPKKIISIRDIVNSCVNNFKPLTVT